MVDRWRHHSLFCHCRHSEKFRTRKKKEKILSEVKQNTAAAQRMAAELSSLLEHTEGMRKRLISSYESTLSSFGKDYTMLGKDEQGISPRSSTTPRLAPHC